MPWKCPRCWNKFENDFARHCECGYSRDIGPEEPIDPEARQRWEAPMMTPEEREKAKFHPQTISSKCRKYHEDVERRLKGKKKRPGLKDGIIFSKDGKKRFLW